MAQIDPRIAMGFQPQTQLESPVNALARVLQVQGLQQQNQANQMKVEESVRAQERSNRLADLYRGAVNPDGTIDRNRLFAGAAQAGFGEQIPALQEQFAKADKQAGEVKAQDFKLASDRYGMFKKTLGSLSASPNLSKDLVIQAGQELVNAGVLPPEMFQKSVANLPDDPNALRATLRQSAASQLTPEQIFSVFAPKVEKIDNGQQIAFRDTNPNSPTFGQQTAGATVQKQQTPDSIASNVTTRRGQDMVDARARDKNTIDAGRLVGPDGKPAKPMPATALKMQNEALDMIGIASSIQADLGTIEQQLKSGALDFGPVKNVVNSARNMAGVSNEQSRNFATFKSTLEKLRNDSLRLNKGVQTDGDAQRAWNELFQNINDPGVVNQRLAEIKKINARAVDLRKREVEDIRNNYNQPQYDFSTQTNVPSAITAPSGSADIDALLEKYK